MDKKNKLKYFSWRFGDRSDGWRVRNVNTLFSVVPYILSRRTDSEVSYQVKVPIDHIEQFIKNHKSDIPDLSIMHIFMAGIVRTFSQRPYMNRFVVWNRLYARNHISFSIAIKKAMTLKGEETVIKPYFLPTDTLQDVVEKINNEVTENKTEGQVNSSDIISKLLGYLPPFLLRTVVGCVKFLDVFNLMPRFLFDASPFHSSLFLTNLGSIGGESIYHHLYEFGTCSTFVSMGKKIKNNELQKDGTMVNSKYIQLKIVLDERICDGFYFSSTIRLFEKYLSDPEQLLSPPETVIIDDGVNRKQKQ